MGRNRVIYQSEALFISPNSTGNHYIDGSGNGIDTAASSGYTDGVTVLTLNNGKDQKSLLRVAPIVTGTDTFAPVWEVGDIATTDLVVASGLSGGGSGAQAKVTKVDQAYWGGAAKYDPSKTYDAGEIVLYKNTGATPVAWELAVAVVDPGRAGLGYDVNVNESPDVLVDAVNGIGGTFGGGAGRWAAADDAACLASGSYDYATSGFDYGVAAGEIPVVKWEGTIYKRIDIAGTAGAGATVASQFDANATPAKNVFNLDEPSNNAVDWAPVSDAIGYITEVEITAPGKGYPGTGASVATATPDLDAMIFTKDYELNDDVAGKEAFVEALKINTVSGVVAPSSGDTVVQQLSRVQTANYNFTINRTDVNQFGQLGRIDSLVLEAPTVGLDFSYLLTNGENERLLGFNTNAFGAGGGVAGASTPGGSDVPALAFHASEDSKDGNNYFVLTVPEGDDAVGSSAASTNKSVISVGNGFITDYSVEAAVGGLPTGSVTVEAFNIKSDEFADEIEIPAIDTEDAAQAQNAGLKLCNQYFTLPAATEDGSNAAGTQIAALRPGDIELSLGDNTNSALIADVVENGSAHIQSFSISCPIGRSVIQRLGNQYGFGRSIDFPVSLSVSVNAILAELETANLIDRLYDNPVCNLSLTLNEPLDPDCTVAGTRVPQLKFIIAGCRLESENYSSSIGDNKTVDLTFNAQLGGPNDKKNGLFVYGSGNLRNPPWFVSKLGQYQESKV